MSQGRLSRVLRSRGRGQKARRARTKARGQSLGVGDYDLLSNTICIFTNGRSTKDILRSIAHEMIHADQYHNKGWNLEPAVNGLGEGSLKHAEEIEGDAYRRGNLALRKWEDRLKAKFS